MTASEPIIAVRAATWSARGRPILTDVTLDVRRGEILSIMGRSGSGKTTLLRIMSGLVRADSGEVRVDGADLVAMPETELDQIRLRMGVVFQYAALFDSLTVYENIVFGVRRNRSRVPREELDGIVHTTLEQVGLGGTGPLYPSELSGGMQKRVGLARALAMQPEILFYDEPTSGLDPVTARTIDDLILATRERLGVTSVVVSHNLRSIFRCSDSVAMLHDGRLAASGSTTEIRASAIPVVREFIDADSGPATDAN